MFGKVKLRHLRKPGGTLFGPFRQERYIDIDFYIRGYPLHTLINPNMLLDVLFWPPVPLAGVTPKERGLSWTGDVRREDRLGVESIRGHPFAYPGNVDSLQHPLEGSDLSTK